MELSFVALGLVVFIAYTVQTMSGFGSMLIALTIGAHLYPIPYILVLMIPLSLLQCGYIVARHHRGIDVQLLVRRILPLMGLGMVGGFAVVDRVQGTGLRTAFAILVLLLSAKELVTLIRNSGPASKPLAAPIFIPLVAGAGVLHGIYATGGPMLVYAVNRKGLDKHAFRSTLTVVWLVLNTALLISFWYRGQLTTETTTDALYLVPAIPLGIIVGEFLHSRVNELRFQMVTFALLIVAAVTLLLR